MRNTVYKRTHAWECSASTGQSLTSLQQLHHNAFLLHSRLSVGLHEYGRAGSSVADYIPAHVNGGARYGCHACKPSRMALMNIWQLLLQMRPEQAEPQDFERDLTRALASAVSPFPFGSRWSPRGLRPT